MSKILIHTIAFSPDGVSTAYLYNDIALRLKSEGFQVVVLTTTPHFNIVHEDAILQPLIKKMAGLYYQSNFKGIKIIHIPQKKFNNTLLRLFGFLYWHIFSFFAGLLIRNIQVILSPSPPLTIGLLNILLGKIKKAKVIYNVQEIYPDLLIELGNLKSVLLTNILKKIEKIVYDKSDMVITIDEIFYKKIINRFKDKSKLQIIPNFVDTEIYKPIIDFNKIIDNSIFPVNDSLKLLYAGNIGFAQDWDVLIEVAIEIRNENVDFFVIGEGVLKDKLMSEIKKFSLSNIHVIQYQKREKIPAILNYADIHFIFMTPETEGQGFPSKVYTIMACGKPLLVCSGKNTPVVNFLENKKCSFIVTEKEQRKKVEELVSLIKTINKENLKEMGNCGYNVVKDNYSKEVVTLKYVEIIKSIT